MLELLEENTQKLISNYLVIRQESNKIDLSVRKRDKKSNKEQESQREKQDFDHTYSPNFANKLSRTKNTTDQVSITQSILSLPKQANLLETLQCLYKNQQILGLKRSGTLLLDCEDTTVMETSQYCLPKRISPIKEKNIQNPLDKSISIIDQVPFIDFSGHFKQNKQSSCRIKCVSGVSYVKKSESNQIGVEKKYQKLPPIVIQDSYYLGELTDQKLIQEIDSLCIERLYSEQSYFLCTLIKSKNEIAMKNYLLEPHNRLKFCEGNVFFVKSHGLNACRELIENSSFLCIHFIYDPNLMLKNIEQKDLSNEKNIAQFIFDSDVCFGILTKKGEASVKTIKKVYRLHNKSSEENKSIAAKLKLPSDTNTDALMMKMELYVDENRWKSVKSQNSTQESFKQLINSCEKNFFSVLIDWIKFQRDGKVHKIQVDTDKYIFEERKPSLWDPLKLGVQKIPIRNFPQNFGKINIQKYSHSFESTQNLPITLINTKDCFVTDLHVEETKFEMKSYDITQNLAKCFYNNDFYAKETRNVKYRTVLKKQFYFTLENIPENYRKICKIKKGTNLENPENRRVGITTYENFYSHQELEAIENYIEETEKNSLNDAYLPMTAQKTFSGASIKRTKLFFGYRYLWDKQMNHSSSHIAAGIRADVSRPPIWVKEIIEDPLVAAGILPNDFINSVALNIYHDGTEGLAQHFDDATRFKQPIYTVRLFSDSRLSFGNKYFGYCNGLFQVPLPRGCICVMEEGSYASNGVKHCIRPCDMMGKSAAMILRQMHPNVVSEAIKYDQNIDLPKWMSSLSLENDSIPFHQQKENEYSKMANSTLRGKQKFEY